MMVTGYIEKCLHFYSLLFGDFFSLPFSLLSDQLGLLMETSTDFFMYEAFSKVKKLHYSS